MSARSADVTALRTPAETGLGELFDRLRGGLPGDVAVREAALAGFTSRGLPHRRVEEFKYFDLRALMREAAPPAERPDTAAIESALALARLRIGTEAEAITFVNGHGLPLPRLPDGITVTPLGAALGSGDPMLAHLGSAAIARDNPILQLNTAFMSDGALIRVPAGASPSPLAIRFVNHGPTAFSTAIRILVVVEEGASVTLVETHEGPDGIRYQPNTAVELVLGDRAQCRHVRVNAEGQGALALSTLTARLGAEARLQALNVVTGAAAARHQVFATFAGEGGTASIDGITILGGTQHADSTLVVDHAVPHCQSRELFKTILDGEATGVFQGKIIVRPQAQKTDGGMKSDTLLLSDGASMNNKPELEIFADDVVCGHGATCGALDEDLLFYLKSRGLPTVEAERLMLQAFVGPPLEAVEDEDLREALVGIVEARLAAR